MKDWFEKHPFTKTGLVALPLILFLVAMGNYFPKEAAGGFNSFIIAFEFARTTGDIQSALGPHYPDGLSNIDTGNYIDFGFMLVYSLFLALFSIKAATHFQKKWLMAAVFLAFIALISDAAENIFLLKITSRFEPGAWSSIQPFLNQLFWITRLKWFVLAVTFFLFAFAVYKTKPVGKFFSVAFILPLGIAIGGNMKIPSAINAFTSSVFVAFGVLALFCFVYRKTS